MNVLSELPLEIQLLFRNIAKNKHRLTSYCEEIKDCKCSDHQNNVLLLWMVRSWLGSYSRNSCQTFNTVVLNVEDVIQMIGELQLEESFCQVSKVCLS